MALVQVVGPIPTVATVPTQVQGGRLTLDNSTKLPVPSSDLTGKTDVWFVPYNGRGVAVWNDTLQTWRTLSIPDAGISVALGTLTSGKNYDVFVYDNAGSLALELSAAWNSDTARASGGSGTDLARVDGVWIKKAAGGANDKTRRYLGTFRTTSTTATEDSHAKRFLWNMDNRVTRASLTQDSTASWTYSSGTAAQLNGAAAAWQHEHVFGLDEDVTFTSMAVGITNAPTSDGVTGIGIDSASIAYSWGAMSTTVGPLSIVAPYASRLGLGYHTVLGVGQQGATPGAVITYQGGSWCFMLSEARR